MSKKLKLTATKVTPMTDEELQIEREKDPTLEIWAKELRQELADYEAFLRSKQLKAIDTGLEVPLADLHSALFDYQAPITQIALRKGRFAIFADVGLGKTLMLAEWAKQLAVRGHRVIIFAPLAVARQTVNLVAEKLGYEIRFITNSRQVDIDCDLYITNFEQLHNIDPDKFQAVVLDECFPANTPIDCVDDNGNVYQKHIENIEIGDRIINASGIDIVSDVHRREVQYAVKIKVNGKEIISSPNHPYFTQRGWVGAQDLEPNDKIISVYEAMRMVQSGFCDYGLSEKPQSLLQQVLFSEMAYEPARISGESTYTRGSSKTGQEKIGMVQVGESRGVSGIGTNTQSESDGQSRNTAKIKPHIENHEAQTFRAWGQWDWIDRSTIEDANGTWEQLDSGIQFVTGETSSRLSNMLQARLSEYRAKSVYRSGWTLTQESQGTGHQEGYETGFYGVDSLEILELGHPELDKFRDVDGKLYFYDIGATQHPSFSIEGMLVHNSSILKSIDGKTQRKLISAFRKTPYRLCCSATPAPNDVNELGKHAEFLGVMTQAQMSSTFFVNDSGARADGRTNKWRLKAHATQHFYRWLASWSCAIRKPSDLGFSDDNYKLPKMEVHNILVDTHYRNPNMLPGFEVESLSAIEAKKVRKMSIDSRAEAIADIINNSDEQWIVWTGLNDEAYALAKLLNNSINIEGKTSLEAKVDGIEKFVSGAIKVLISKASIAGMGMNLQHCRNMVYFGLDYSWEGYYQALGRIRRFGQQFDTIHIYHVMSKQAVKVYDVIKHKGKQAEAMMGQLIKATHQYTMDELHQNYKEIWKYQDAKHVAPSGRWEMWNGDSAIRMKEIDDNSIDLSVYSPPFSDVFVYSNTEHDLGNNTSLDKFFQHYEFFITQLLRITKPGRLTCVHVQDTRTHKGTDGFRGIVDFTGRVIQAYVDAGWIFRSRVTLDENPQAEAIRTHDTDLQFVTMDRDAAALAPMAPDYILVFKKQGDNAVPVLPVANGDLTREDWIRYAHPVWYDIDRTKVLNAKVAKTDSDEKHMCPLQLTIIEPLIKLYSNPGELVFDPFAGIGSTVYEAVKWRRRGLGIELKPEYYEVAIRNCQNAEKLRGKTLLDLVAENEAVQATGD